MRMLNVKKDTVKGKKKLADNVTEDVTNSNANNVTEKLLEITKSQESRVKSLDIRDKSLDIDKTDLKKDKTIKRYNDKTACANFITKRLFDDSLIKEDEFDEFDKMICDYIDDYDAVDVLVKSKYILHKIIDKNINNRRAYFYKAMSTNLKENYNIEKQADELDVDLDELNETLKQFE